MGDSPDTLLKDGERWMFTYGKGRAKILFGSFQQAVERMLSYELTQGLITGKIDGSEDDIEEKLVSSIKIMKTGERPRDYREKKGREEKMRAAERKKIQRDAARNLKRQGIEVPTVFGGSVDLLQSMTTQNEALEKRIKELEGNNASKSRGVSKAGAKAVSRSTKKPATNKGGKISAKKVTAKPATRKARKKGK